MSLIDGTYVVCINAHCNTRISLCDGRGCKRCARCVRLEKEGHCCVGLI